MLFTNIMYIGAIEWYGADDGSRDQPQVTRSTVWREFTEHILLDAYP